MTDHDAQPAREHGSSERDSARRPSILHPDFTPLPFREYSTILFGAAIGLALLCLAQLLFASVSRSLVAAAILVFILALAAKFQPE